MPPPPSFQPSSTLYPPSISISSPTPTSSTPTLIPPPPPPPSSSSPPTFQFPPYHTSYPPFFTLQPTVSTRLAQLHKWSLLIQRYCAHYRLFRLSIASPTTLDSPLFFNARLRKRLSAAHVKAVFVWMVGKEGGGRAEWIADGDGEGGREGSVWVFWKRPEEWAEVLWGWVS